jgi:hypothetical protein
MLLTKIIINFYNSSLKMSYHSVVAQKFLYLIRLLADTKAE